MSLHTIIAYSPSVSGELSTTLSMFPQDGLKYHPNSNNDDTFSNSELRGQIYEYLCTVLKIDMAEHRSFALQLSGISYCLSYVYGKLRHYLQSVVLALFEEIQPHLWNKLQLFSKAPDLFAIYSLRNVSWEENVIRQPHTFSTYVYYGSCWLKPKRIREIYSCQTNCVNC